MRRVGGQRGERGEWWSEEVGVAVSEMRKAFEEWLQRIDKETFDRYRAQRAAAKQAIKVAKKWPTGDGESDWGMNSREIKTHENV